MAKTKDRSIDRAPRISWRMRLTWLRLDDFLTRASCNDHPEIMCLLAVLDLFNFHGRCLHCWPDTVR